MAKHITVSHTVKGGVQTTERSKSVSIQTGQKSGGQSQHTGKTNSEHKKI